MRTPFQETSEALFLTSGYAYEKAEEAEARFKGEIGGYQYTPLRQSHRLDVRGAHGGAGRRAGGARHRHRHGGGVGDVSVPR